MAPTPKAITMIAVGLFLVGLIGTLGMNAIANASTTGWNSSVVTIWKIVLPIIAAVGIGLLFLPSGKGE